MPHKTFPRALLGAVVLVVLTYLLPLMVGLGVTPVIKDWKLGYFAYIAKTVRPLCATSVLVACQSRGADSATLPKIANTLSLDSMNVNEWRAFDDVCSSRQTHPQF